MGSNFDHNYSNGRNHGLDNHLAGIRLLPPPSVGQQMLQLAKEYKHLSPYSPIPRPLIVMFRILSRKYNERPNCPGVGQAKTKLTKPTEENLPSSYANAFFLILTDDQLT